MFKNMNTAERVQAAKEKTKRVVDHLVYLLALHENNAIILYSPTLASQIPKSYAANAFNVFKQGMHSFELVRLCALWDGPGLDRENIPTVIELIDDLDVIEALAKETASHWANIGGCLLNPSDDPALRALEVEAMQRNGEHFGRKEAQRARDGLRKEIADSRAILESPKWASIKNLRDKHLAHSLSKTWGERAGPLPLMKYGDERDMLDRTLPIVEALYCWVNGTSFNFEDSRAIHRGHAKALWERCTFDIQNADGPPKRNRRARRTAGKIS